MIQSFINWKRRRRFSRHENLGYEARLPFSCLTADAYGRAEQETFYISRTGWTCKNLAFSKMFHHNILVWVKSVNSIS